MTSPRSSRRVSIDALESLCESAVRVAGGSAETAAVLASATVAAERRGRREVGVAHLIDYLDAFRGGRLNRDAQPQVSGGRAAVVTVDADRGTAQLAFAHAFAELVERARACGVAVLAVYDSYSAGELGHYASRVAEEGLIALACANSPALMAAYGAREPITGTNPLSFALPHPSGPRMFDQATSATAWVTIRDAALRGEAIPDGWALDADGNPTGDASAALGGALLPFGGVKGANIAIMIEMLAAMAGGSFSLDAAPFDSGAQSPRLGLFVVAIDPTAFDPSYVHRAETHLQLLATAHGADFGRRKPPVTEVELSEDLYLRLVTP
ncbi:Ldh family oxidoreductase [Streptomyces sp. BE147]|uniref:Ldh family oxidoreductase n=1 Tax=Streptomyces sp. BE147 TaxID=3002524 RepID=UPI002E79D16D|nr:Ldh family oxidoreductase [Streptomyces sp. BE147]MEE1738245.1 Ldh family oxidoreductase [Streptomyces sp. BE147]